MAAILKPRHLPLSNSVRQRVVGEKKQTSTDPPNSTIQLHKGTISGMCLPLKTTTVCLNKHAIVILTSQL